MPASGGLHYAANPEDTVVAVTAVLVQAGVVVDPALQAEPVAFVVDQVSKTLEACSQTEDFHVEFRG